MSSGFLKCRTTDWIINPKSVRVKVSFALHRGEIKEKNWSVLHANMDILKTGYLLMFWNKNTYSLKYWTYSIEYWRKGWHKFRIYCQFVIGVKKYLVPAACRFLKFRKLSALQSAQLLKSLLRWKFLPKRSVYLDRTFSIKNDILPTFT